MKSDFICFLIVLKRCICQTLYPIDAAKEKLTTNPPLFPNLKISGHISVYKLLLVNYIDDLWTRANNSPLPFQNDDLRRLFKANVVPLNTLQNYITLIVRYQKCSEEYRAANHDRCRKSIYQTIHRNKRLCFKGKSRADIMRSFAMNNTRCEIRIDYMQRCNNALRPMYDEFISDGIALIIDVALIIKRCDEMDQRLEVMRSSHSEQPVLDWASDND